MAFESNFVDNLKAAVNIVDVIGRDVQLKKGGSSYKGLCPFHNEKTPSFSVSEQKQYFNCFGCGAKGDVIEYVRLRNNLTFMEAVEKLCEEYNIKMPERSGPRIDYDKYYEINRQAARFFFKTIVSGPNPGYSYIKSRGITDDTIKTFGIGYAPDSWTGLYKALSEQGISDEDMLTLGLVLKGREGLYDKFRNRVIFPIFNTQGKVIGFGGRALGSAMPKYLNSNESEIFLKKNNLYALNFTKNEIADADRAIIVEGYMDAISLYQNGVKNVAASLGTALTDNQGKLLSRYTKNVVLSYDSDSAGISAAVRGIDILKKADCNVRILHIDDGKDPDDYIKKNGRERFERLVNNAIPATDFRLQILKQGYDLDDSIQVLDYIRKCVPLLRSLGPVEQNMYIKQLAEEFGLSETAITMEVKAGDEQEPRQSFPRRESIRKSEQTSGAAIRAEMSFLVLAAYNTKYIERIKKDEIVFKTGIARKIYETMISIDNLKEYGGTGINKKKLFDALDPEEESMFTRALDIIKIGPDDEAFYKRCLAKHKLRDYEERRVQLINEIAVAEQMEDAEHLQELANELVTLEKAIKKIKEN